MVVFVFVVVGGGGGTRGPGEEEVVHEGEERGGGEGFITRRICVNMCVLGSLVICMGNHRFDGEWVGGVTTMQCQRIHGRRCGYTRIG
jgi:hypothetical protein